MAYFDIKRDNALIAAGGFFCEACVVGKPANEQSPDGRYCLGCQEVLSKEASLLSAGKHPAWVPRAAKPSPEAKHVTKTTPENQYKVAGDMVLNMATVKDEKVTVAIITPRTPNITHTKRRGPKQKALPVELISQWANEGMGYKRIAARLKAEYGTTVGFRTIARVVKGERLLL